LAPAILKGLRPVDVASSLREATPGQVATLTATNLALWSQYSGILVDKRKFSFDQYRHLIDLYLDDHPHMAIQKAAQMGLTIYLLLRAIWLARYHEVNVGFYFPTDSGVAKISKARLKPMIQSNEILSQALVDSTDSVGLKMLRNIHGTESTLYLMHIGGVDSKDSTPLDALFFDEVRLMEMADIEQTLYRIRASTMKLKVFASTAGLPGADINKLFLSGDQRVFHTKCSCSEGIDLAETFPDCMAVRSNGQVYYRCPRCKFRIRDPQNGAYVIRNPGADMHSYRFSSLISPHVTPKEIWEAYKSSSDQAEFWNSSLGLPWVDEQNMPITQDVCENAVYDSLRWGRATPGEKCGDRVMGVDAMSGNAYAVVLEREQGDRVRLVHAEIIEAANPHYYHPDSGRPVSPYYWIDRLIGEFNPLLTLVDAQPNWNEGAELAHKYRGKVFLAYYSDAAGTDVVKWADAKKDMRQRRKAGPRQHLKWQVILHRYKAIDEALSDWSNGRVRTPPPESLMQFALDSQGRVEPTSTLRTLWYHLQNIARDRRTGNTPIAGAFKMTWRNVACDPHFVHAYTYAKIALSRAKRRPIFTLL